jgi:putative oxidoreductase
MKTLIANYRNWMNSGAEALGRDLGLLGGRVALGGMMLLAHGLPKLQNFGAYSAKFPDPLGVGSPISMALAILAEFGCSALVIVGLGTRLATSQLIATMGVAAFLVHGGDPFFAAPGDPSKEFALVYLAGFALLFFTGPGRFSIDHLIAKKATQPATTTAPVAEPATTH